MGKKEFEASKATEEAKKAVQEQARKRPEYAGRYDQALSQALDALMQQPSFRYRLDGDALYKRYRDSAVKNGRLAMEDTLGQGAALTGGYGNSYAQSAGQQAYARQLDALADRIPELYTLAMEQYRLQSQGLKDKYNLLLGADSRDYGRYTDSLEAWQKEADRLLEAYRTQRKLDYQTYRDDIADWKWQTEYDEDKRRYDQQWEAAHQPAPQVRYVSSASSKKKKSSTPPGLVGAVLGALSSVGLMKMKKGS